MTEETEVTVPSDINENTHFASNTFSENEKNQENFEVELEEEENFEEKSTKEYDNDEEDSLVIETTNIDENKEEEESKNEIENISQSSKDISQENTNENNEEESEVYDKTEVSPAIVDSKANEETEMILPKEKREKKMKKRPPFTTHCFVARGTPLGVTTEPVSKFGRTQNAKTENESETPKESHKTTVVVQKSGIKSFSDIRMPEKCRRIDIAHNRVHNFDGLKLLQQLTTLIVDSNPIRSFKGAMQLPNLRYVSFKQCPISRNPYLKLMTLIAFDDIKIKKDKLTERKKIHGSIKFVNNEQITTALQKQALQLGESLRERLYQGDVLISLSPVKLVNNEVESQVYEDRIVEPTDDLVEATVKMTTNMNFSATRAKKKHLLMTTSREPAKPSSAVVCNEILAADDISLFVSPEVISSALEKLQKLRERFPEMDYEDDNEEETEQEIKEEEEEELSEIEMKESSNSENEQEEEEEKAKEVLKIDNVVANEDEEEEYNSADYEEKANKEEEEEKFFEFENEEEDEQN